MGIDGAGDHQLVGGVDPGVGVGVGEVVGDGDDAAVTDADVGPDGRAAGEDGAAAGDDEVEGGHVPASG